MAITVTSTPSLVSPTNRPLLWEVTSDRYTDIAQSVTSIADNGSGFCRYTVSANNLKVGDVVVGTGFTGTQTGSNVRQTVTAITATTFDTDIAFVATSTGTITRDNNNFQIKNETFVFDNAKRNLSNCGNNGGFAQFTTSTPHGLLLGDVVYFQNTASGNYDGLATVTSVTSTTTFITDQAYVATTAVGTVRSGRLIGITIQSALTSGSTTYFRTNVDKHVLSTTSPDLITGSPSNIQDSLNNSHKTYAVRFTELFDDADGLQQEYDLILSVFRHAPRVNLKRTEADLSNRIILLSGEKFLTDMPSRVLIRPGEEYQLSFLDYGAGIVNKKVAYIERDMFGTTISTNFSSLSAVVDGKGVAMFNSNWFSSNMYEVEVNIVDNSPSQYSESKFFRIDKRFYQNSTRIYFENIYGSIDAFTFTGKHTESVDITRTQYKKQFPLTYDVTARGLQIIQSTDIKIREVYSEMLSNEEARWLEQMLSSPNVWIRNAGGTNFLPIQILTNSQLSYSPEAPIVMKVAFRYAFDRPTLNN